MMINTPYSKFNKRRYQKNLRKRKGKDVEVYGKREREDVKGAGRPSMVTTNKRPDLSCPDRNEGLKINYGGPRENWAILNKKRKAKLSPEMEERERKAQEELKRKPVAPLYNKGPYGVVNKDEIKDIGKK